MYWLFPRRLSGQVTCVPHLQLNIFVRCTAYAVREADDSAPGHAGDTPLLGNDFSSNGNPLLDEGQFSLGTVAEVNALDGNWGDFDADPGLVDLPGGNLHLSSTSMAIDACVVPRRPGQCSISTINPEPSRAMVPPPVPCDAGADEYHP